MSSLVRRKVSSSSLIASPQKKKRSAELTPATTAPVETSTTSSTTGATASPAAARAAALSSIAVFVNPGSGGGQGHDIAARLSRLLEPNRVFLIGAPDNLPEHGLQRFLDVPNLRVLVAGGDGTVNWVLNSMAKVAFASPPPVGVLPLGTGNDLALSLGWTGIDGSDNLDDDLLAILVEMAGAEVIEMDRWLVHVDGDGAALPDGSNDVSMTNYCSLGVDSQVALKFHELRQSHPELFISRSANRAYYALLGFTTMFDGIDCLRQHARVFCDDVEIDLPETIAGIVIMNIPSYAGGACLWGDDDDDDDGGDDDSDDDDNDDNDGGDGGNDHGARRATRSRKHFVEPSVGDGLLEVVGVTSSAHMGLISVHLANAIRLAQCSRMRVEFTSTLPFQVDGEPHMRPKSTLTVNRLPQRVPMLLRSQPDDSDDEKNNHQPL
jgi:diacylglycerol kinase (ATP)